MARVTKTKTPATSEQTETPKKTVTKKTTSKTVATPSAATPAATIAPPTNADATPVAAETKSAADIESEALGEQFSEFMVKLQSVGSVFASLKNDFRALEKQVLRQMKQAKRLSSKRSKSKGNRQPSGFVKPTLVSDELASFLGKPSGCEMARTEVTREINKYIRAKNLQDPANGRHIIPDAALSKLLSLSKEDELTYFNLQKYMSPHFPKSGAAAAAAAAALAASAASAQA
jgi:upstream activation factor subunit UAF30